MLTNLFLYRQRFILWLHNSPPPFHSHILTFLSWQQWKFIVITLSVLKRNKDDVPPAYDYSLRHVISHPGGNCSHHTSLSLLLATHILRKSTYQRASTKILNLICDNCDISRYFLLYITKQCIFYVPTCIYLHIFFVTNRIIVLTRKFSFSKYYRYAIAITLYKPMTSRHAHFYCWANIKNDCWKMRSNYWSSYHRYPQRLLRIMRFIIYYKSNF